jgi:hypothetical protein
MILGAVAFMRVYEGWLEQQTLSALKPDAEAAAAE